MKTCKDCLFYEYQTFYNTNPLVEPANFHTCKHDIIIKNSIVYETLKTLKICSKFKNKVNVNDERKETNNT